MIKVSYTESGVDVNPRPRAGSTGPEKSSPRLSAGGDRSLLIDFLSFPIIKLCNKLQDGGLGNTNVFFLCKVRCILACT
jgi:hypothetical protein